MLNQEKEREKKKEGEIERERGMKKAQDEGVYFRVSTVSTNPSVVNRKLQKGVGT